MDGSFELIGSESPASPVVLSVPHAGRDYPSALLSALRVPKAALLPLEDRHVDAVAHGARGVETILVQRHPRAWIDLNRSEGERDPRIDEGAVPTAQPLQSAKLRSGLGLVPRRAGRSSELWSRRFTAAEISARIEQDHRPYHHALARTLAAARVRFGIAVLLDVHSMPPLASGVQLVFGDRFGRAAGARFVDRLEAEAMGFGIRSAINTPYAGGHILDAHGAPAGGIHAIQLEIDRGLYLDGVMEALGPGLARTVAVVRRMLAALEDEALGNNQALAAE